VMVRYCGRDFSEKEIEGIRSIIKEDSKRSRYKISLLVCEDLGWRKPDGELKDMSCRVALLRMQKDGLIRLPAPKWRHGNHTICIQRTSLGEPGFPVHLPVHMMSDLHLELVGTKKASGLWNEYIDRYHYLGYTKLPGAQLRYFATFEGQEIALFGFGAAAWKVQPRDRFIGWTPEQRQRNLHLIVNNARFLITLLPGSYLWFPNACLKTGTIDTDTARSCLKHLYSVIDYVRSHNTLHGKLLILCNTCLN